MRCLHYWVKYMALGVLLDTFLFVQIKREFREPKNGISNNFWNIFVIPGISVPLLHLQTRTTPKSMHVLGSFQRQNTSSAFGTAYAQSKLDSQFYDASQGTMTFWRPKRNFHLWTRVSCRFRKQVAQFLYALHYKCRLISLTQNLQHDEIVPQKIIPRLKVWFDNKLVNKGPPQPAKHTPQLTIRLNGIIHSLIPLPSQARNEGLTDMEDPEMEESLLNRVEKFIQASANDQDSEDGPEWMFDKGENLSKSSNYVFCPAPHRGQILHLFTSHFCQHPMFPERRGNYLTGDEIRQNAVWEMYDFCRQRNLREVWGYMWSSWYSPKMWKLWARSTTPYLSRLRTTMNVENFWRQLKHDYLHHVPRPRLDQLVWILVHRVTPSYTVKMDLLRTTNRLGRSNGLTTYQKYFKKSWKRLEKVPMSKKSTYTTDVARWSCNCGHQKYDAHHLCKHLVQAVNPPPPEFWGEVIRRRKPPIYHHHSLVPRREDPSSRLEPIVTGSITDGDDVEWNGDVEILRGGGGWEAMLGTSHNIPQERRQKKQPPFSDDNESNKENQPSIDIPGLNRPPAEIIDLTLVSGSEDEDRDVLAPRIVLRSSSPGTLPSEDEDDQASFKFRHMRICLPYR